MANRMWDVSGPDHLSRDSARWYSTQLETQGEDFFAEPFECRGSFAVDDGQGPEVHALCRYCRVSSNSHGHRSFRVLPVGEGCGTGAAEDPSGCKGTAVCRERNS